MDHPVRIAKSFPLPHLQLFDYFAERSLLERWSFPNGMTLRLPVFEAWKGGKYRYAHTGKAGTFVAEGFFKEFNSQEIAQTDLSVSGPDGTTLFENLECRITFVPKAMNTEVHILQTGFTNQSDAAACEKGWQQSLEHLETLIKSRSAGKKAAS